MEEEGELEGLRESLRTVRSLEETGTTVTSTVDISWKRAKTPAVEGPVEEEKGGEKERTRGGNSRCFLTMSKKAPWAGLEIKSKTGKCLKGGAQSPACLTEKPSLDRGILRKSGKGRGE